MTHFNYAITGHTAGIGKMLFETLSPNIIGFSRTNGYDITVSNDRARITELSDSCDVFINNAHAGYGQTLMLYELFDKWKNKNKLIINIGSDTVCGIKSHPHLYSTQKAALDKGSEQLSHLNMPCKVTNLRFGYVGTDRILNSVNPASFIELTDIPEIINYIVKWSNKYRLTDILLRPQ
jgi:short-subunit dehydrogenase